MTESVWPREKEDGGVKLSNYSIIIEYDILLNNIFILILELK